MYALADCNNFYASCERIFNPSLKNKPIIVLSNNDGCVIARSNEAKKLNVKMGIPVFKIKHLIKRYNINVFSTNFTLYGDISKRVMTLLSTYTPHIEIYSIDEAFLDFSYIPYTQYYQKAVGIRNTIKRSTGIPISIGIAPTKTLSKLANHIAKKNTQCNGVFIISDVMIPTVKNIPINKIWGIGNKLSLKLNYINIFTIEDFINTSDYIIQKVSSINGVKIKKELQGIKCHSLKEVRQRKKSICTSRSFGEMVSSFNELSEAISMFSARCSEKLRFENGCAKTITIFIMSNRHRKDLKQYSNYIKINLPVATDSTNEIIKHALNALQKIYKSSYQYKKCGVVLSDIINKSEVQCDIFDNIDRHKQKSIMNAVDEINANMGADSIKYASQGIRKQDWTLKRQKLSPSYTTQWNYLPIINTK